MLESAVDGMAGARPVLMLDRTAALAEVRQRGSAQAHDAQCHELERQHSSSVRSTACP